METTVIRPETTTPSQGQTGSCLLLNVNDTRMLVPRNLVAEVIRHTFVELHEDEDSGLHCFEWRGCQVPHVRSSLVGGKQKAPVTEDTRLVIFYGLQNTRVLPFYGFAINQRPQLLQVGGKDLEEIAGAVLHPGELMKVIVRGEEAFIPRVDYFENAILKLIH